MWVFYFKVPKATWVFFNHFLPAKWWSVQNPTECIINLGPTESKTWMYWPFFSLFQFAFDLHISQQPVRSCEYGLICLHGMEALWHRKSRSGQNDCEWYFFTCWIVSKLGEAQIGKCWGNLNWRHLRKCHGICF